jgi:hypothetical protein
VHEKAVVLGGGNACRVLATMLQYQQSVIEQLIDW